MTRNVSLSEQIEAHAINADITKALSADMKAEREANRQDAAELTRLRALNAELVEALETISKIQSVHGVTVNCRTIIDTADYARAVLARARGDNT